MIVVNFKYAPSDYVKIIAFGLNCEGRVSRCTYDGGALIYSVQYAMESRLHREEFYEDELEKK